ncbi:hypothetical protein E2C01_038102 [Portunus trituberculatus]|uniref:Secreted protein n=1 Tax=Portunus trituberculatus TaxID=210409 RepID=A0A5B7F9Y5_PORTR|nr:hypothetical protein [Portunus trituberculatus]
MMVMVMVMMMVMKMVMSLVRIASPSECFGYKLEVRPVLPAHLHRLLTGTDALLVLLLLKEHRWKAKQGKGHLLKPSTLPTLICSGVLSTSIFSSFCARGEGVFFEEALLVVVSEASSISASSSAPITSRPIMTLMQSLFELLVVGVQGQAALEGV